MRDAINAVSDVVQNRPRPLREFDQIYMKVADMVLQSEFVAEWANGKRLAFMGDGDAISVCVAYLHHRDILLYGPSRIVVYDFDERICNAVTRFADKERLETLSPTLYNVQLATPSEWARQVSSAAPKGQLSRRPRQTMRAPTRPATANAAAPINIRSRLVELPCEVVPASDEPDTATRGTFTPFAAASRVTASVAEAARPFTPGPIRTGRNRFVCLVSDSWNW
ncbi:MAG: hypothetical protein C5B48_07050 [Candidatus Rokuibacteriota bacterium]|nr:MAG: hypothetical protein C5B48_07050 [Candidatus Rokubacteria bacterium]